MGRVMWAVQANLLNEERQQNVAMILKELDIPFVGLNVIPFSDDLDWLFEEPPSYSKVIPYGSTSLVKRAQARNWQGLFFNTNTFLVSEWIKNRDDMLNQNVDIMTVKQAQEFHSHHPTRTLWFIRPVHDLKAFTGMVTTSEEIAKWMKSTDSGNFNFNEDTLVAISQPKEILAEWRWFVVGGKIVDGSMYQHRGNRYKKHETDQAVIDEAQELANKWLPHETVVMDIALTNSGPKVIEFNCFNGSGFYDHDVPKILTEATKYLETK
jgi:hypothetical protein